MGKNKQKEILKFLTKNGRRRTFDGSQILLGLLYDLQEGWN